MVDTSQAEASTMSLRDIISTVRRRKVIAVNVFILIVALGAVVTLMTKPQYRTSAEILVEGRSNSVSMGSNDPFGSVLQPKQGRDVDTQVEILGSSRVLDPVYKQAQVPPGSVSIVVSRVDRTDAISLVFTSTSAPGVEKFANLLPEIYRKQMIDERMGDVVGSLNQAEQSLKDVNDKWLKAGIALEKFKSNRGVVDPQNEVAGAITTAAQNRIDLSKAELESERLKAQLSALLEERRRLSPFTNNAVTTTNPAVQEIKTRIDSLNSTRNKQLFLYTPTDDVIRQIDVEIADAKRLLANTPPTITTTSSSPNTAIPAIDAKISDVRTSLSAAQKDISPLRRAVQQQDIKLGKFNSVERQAALLQRELDSNASQYQSLNNNVQTLKLKKTALENATAPVIIMARSGQAEQISPRLIRNMMAAVFLGLLLACGAALLQDSLDDHIRDEDEARHLLNTSVLGYFPRLPSDRPRPILDVENTDKQLLESFRALRSNVQFALVNSPGQKILVTSSVPGEGKSYVASNLAIAMAMNGRSVILVDTDLHRPTQHEIFGVSRYPGLTNVLIGDAKLRDCVQEVGVPGMRLISAGISPPNPAELLNSAVMDAVVDRLGKGADIIIFDSPPLLATADSQVLSSKVDGVIYVMTLGKVPRSAMLRSFELLKQARARVIGMVFNQVQEKASESYRGYYYSDYSSTPEDSSQDNLALPKNGEKKSSAVLAGARRFMATNHSNGSNGSSRHTSSRTIDDSDEDDED